MQALALAPSARPLLRPFAPPTQRSSPYRPLRAQCDSSRRSRQATRATATSSSPSSSPAGLPQTAKDCVETGLERFAAGDTEGALRLFLAAQELRPNPDEARAACYNAACAQVRLRQWQAAVDSLTQAVNEHDLKLAVALKDPDLEPLRERREWLAALPTMRGGIKEQQYVQLRSEAKAPFRLTRIILFGGLAAGAALGLFIIAGRLLAALQGGEGAPELQETLLNFTINAGALSLLGLLVYRDVSSQARDQAMIQREEELGRLQVSLGGDRVLPLAAFRNTTRPVILAGSRGQLARALAGAEPYQKALRARGVSVVTVQLSAEDAGEKLRQLKAELAAGGSGSGDGTSSSGSRGFGAPEAKAAGAPKAGAAGGLTPKDRKWQLKAAEEGEWVAWLEAQKATAGITADALYVQVQLDGSVRSSGVGAPSWAQLVDDLPRLDSVRSKLTDGAGAGL